MPRLGKLAGEAGLFDLAQQISQDAARHGQVSQDRTFGVQPSSFQGHVGVPQLGMMAGRTFGGELGQTAAAFAPLVLSAVNPQLAQSLLKKQVQLGYGGNTSRVQEAFDANAATQPYASKEFGEASSRQLGRLGINVSPQTLDQFGPALQIAFPQVNQLLGVLDKDYAGDYSPLTRASYALSGGQYRPEIHQAVMDQFDQQYRAGQFGQVPKQIAMAAYERLAGTHGQLDPQQVAGVAAAANQVVQNFGVPFGTALDIAMQHGADRSPAAAIQAIDQMERAAAAHGVDRSELVAAGQAADQLGIASSAGRNAYLMGRGVQRSLGSLGAQAATRYGRAATDAMSDQARSETVTALSGYRALADQSTRQQIDHALANNDVDRIRQFAQQARQDPRTRQFMGTADPSIIASRLTPQAQQALQMDDAMMVAGRQAGGRGLQRVLQDPDRLKRFVGGDWSGLNAPTIRGLSNQRLTGSALAHHQFGKTVGPSNPIPKQIGQT